MKKYFLAVWIVTALSLFSCKKNPAGAAPGPPPVTSPDTLQVDPAPADPGVAGTIGFFMDDWTGKSFTVPSYTDTSLPTAAATVTVSIDAGTVLTRVPRTLFGNNVNIWMTEVITQPGLMADLTNLHSGILRFPGGSLSDVYFWNAPQNTPPADAPVTLQDQNGNEISAGYWYGKNNESWTLSVDNYYHLLEQTGNQGMITINYGYARYGTGPDPVATAAHLAADWVRYDNGRTRYWEIGNEDNGTWEAGYRIDPGSNQDGQPEIITGDLYGSQFSIFADSMRAAAQETGKSIYIGAQLLEKQPESWQTATDQTWNPGVLSRVKSAADFYIIHSYYTAYQTNASASEILKTATDNTDAMITYLKSGFSSAGAPVKPVALTEWNITSQGSRQQVSFISGMHAAILLGQALKDQYGMTARWDLANGWSGGNDMGLFNIGDEPGAPLWNPRPAFYYMYYFQKMLGDRMLKSTVTGSADVLSFASSFISGQRGVILVNTGTSARLAGISINAPLGNRFYWYMLTGGSDNGAFSGKVFVNGKGPGGVSGGPSDFASLHAYSTITGNGLKITLPGRSVAYIVFDKK